MRPTAVPPLDVRNGRFIVHRADGQIVLDDELVGTVLHITAGGRRLDLRIDSLVRERVPTGDEILLYVLSSHNGASGKFEPLCDPDRRGRSLGLPLEGVWDDRGRYVDAPGRFEIACSSGATGKCVLMGYLPWRSPQLRELHQACTRMVRADYCGDGSTHTRDGMQIYVYDRLGVLRDIAPSAPFEAGWSPDGAVCVTRTRVPDVLDIADLRSLCPQRFIKPPGECSERDAQADPRAILFDRH
jgi:hypothetical protein